MASTFATRFLDVASPRLEDMFGGAVTISRGANSTPSVNAAWLREGAEIQTITRMGVKTSFIDREWVIDQADYLINGSAVTPASGDRITDEDNVVWEVMSQPNMPAVEPYGGKLQWLLRTKRIST